MDAIRVVLVISHPDEVSGTSVLSDGVVAYWTEGRSSFVHFYDPASGKRWAASVASADDEHLAAVMAWEGGGPQRAMTLAEEREWGAARSGSDTNVVFCSLSFHGEPVTTEERARVACAALGVRLDSCEDDGCWNVVVSDEQLSLLESDGSLEIEAAGFRLDAEMP